VIQKFEDPAPECTGYKDEETGDVVTHVKTPMVRLIGPTSFRLSGGGWPDKDRQTRKARFQKRNARIEKMTPEQQQGIKNIIDTAGGDRYIP
jgi:hypothetical protein